MRTQTTFGIVCGRFKRFHFCVHEIILVIVNEFAWVAIIFPSAYFLISYDDEDEFGKAF